MIESSGIRGMVFKNWAGTFSCNPEIYFAPKSVLELKQILSSARENGKKVSVVGCGHSPSDLPCTTGYLVSLQNINKILEVDQNKNRFKAEAGITLDELNESLLNYGMSLSCLGSVSSITLGGAIATATHGSGMQFGNLSAYVIELELMTAMGDIINCSKTQNKKIFLASLCNIGALGIILTVTYQCEKAFHIAKRVFPLQLTEVLENLNVHINASEHFGFVWYPHTEGVIVNHLNRTSEPVTKFSAWARLCNWFWVYGMEYHVREFLYWIGSFFPSIVPGVNRFFYNILGCKSKQFVEKNYNAFNMECYYSQYVSEWAVDVKQTALVVWELKQWFEANPHVYAHYAVEVRFVKSDDIYISPSYGRDSCFINIVMYRPYKKFIPYQTYWEGFENIMKNAGGRPHWAKVCHFHWVTGPVDDRFFANDMKANDFNRMYPHWNDWCQIRKKLDPLEMFTNIYIQRIFNNS